MRVVQVCKSFKDGRYNALMYTGSSHLNCIQVILFVRFCFLHTV